MDVSRRQTSNCLFYGESRFKNRAWISSLMSLMLLPNLKKKWIEVFPNPPSPHMAKFPSASMLEDGIPKALFFADRASGSRHF